MYGSSEGLNLYIVVYIRIKSEHRLVEAEYIIPVFTTAVTHAHHAQVVNTKQESLNQCGLTRVVATYQDSNISKINLGEFSKFAEVGKSYFVVHIHFVF